MRNCIRTVKIEEMATRITRILIMVTLIHSYQISCQYEDLLKDFLEDEDTINARYTTTEPTSNDGKAAYADSIDLKDLTDSFGNTTPGASSDFTENAANVATTAQRQNFIEVLAKETGTITTKPPFVNNTPVKAEVEFDTTESPDKTTEKYHTLFSAGSATNVTISQPKLTSESLQSNNTENTSYASTNRPGEGVVSSKENMTDTTTNGTLNVDPTVLTDYREFNTTTTTALNASTFITNAQFNNSTTDVPALNNKTEGSDLSFTTSLAEVNATVSYPFDTNSTIFTTRPQQSTASPSTAHPSDDSFITASPPHGANRNSTSAPTSTMETNSNSSTGQNSTTAVNTQQPEITSSSLSTETSVNETIDIYPTTSTFESTTQEPTEFIAVKSTVSITEEIVQTPSNKNQGLQGTVQTFLIVVLIGMFGVLLIDFVCMVRYHRGLIYTIKRRLCRSYGKLEEDPEIKVHFRKNTTNPKEKNSSFGTTLKKRTDHDDFELFR